MRKVNILVAGVFLGCTGTTPSSSPDAALELPAPDIRPDASVPTEEQEVPRLTVSPKDPGEYAVFRRRISIAGPIKRISARIYAPSKDVGVSVAKGKQFPLVVIMPDFELDESDYRLFAEHFASWGFIAIGINFTTPKQHDQNAAEARAVIDWANKPGTLVSSVVDRSRIALVGHGLGGKIAFFAATLDKRVGAVVAWDPSDAAMESCDGVTENEGCNNWSVAPGSFDGDLGMMDGFSAASLIFAAPERNGVAGPFHARRFWDGVSIPSLYLFLPNAIHTHFRRPTRQYEYLLAARTQIAFLMWHFFSAEGSETYLTGESMQREIDIGNVRLESKLP